MGMSEVALGVGYHGRTTFDHDDRRLELSRGRINSLAGYFLVMQGKR